MKVLAKHGPAYIELHKDYQKNEGEQKLVKLIDHVGMFRMKPQDADILENTSQHENLRRKLFHDFPVMSKL